MANPGDAVIKLLTPVDDDTDFTIDVLPPNTAYDVVADVEIGENLNEFVDDFVLHVAVVNLTTATQVELQDFPGTLTPKNNTQFFDRVRVQFSPIPVNKAAPGDVLQAVASYKVNAGATYDVSTAQSVTFVVG